MKTVLILVALVLISGCQRSEGSIGYQVVEVRPGITCVFTSGEAPGPYDARDSSGVACWKTDEQRK